MSQLKHKHFATSFLNIFSHLLGATLALNLALPRGDFMELRIE